MTPQQTPAVATGAAILDQCHAPAQLATLILELLGHTPDDGPWSLEKVPSREALEARFRKDGVLIKTGATPNAIAVIVPSISIEWLQDSWELDAFHEGWGSVEAFSMQQATSARTVVAQLICGEGFAFRLTMVFEIDAIKHSAMIDWVEGDQAEVSDQVSAWITEFQAAAYRDALQSIGALPKVLHAQVLSDLRRGLAVPQATTEEDPLQAVEHLIGLKGADGQSLLDTSEHQIVLGILDRARERAGHPVPTLPPVDGQFWSLRQMIRASEFPAEDTNPERIYLKLEPFDIGIKREAEGVVVDIWGGDEVGLDSLGSTFAFYADAEVEEETAAA